MDECMLHNFFLLVQVWLVENIVQPGKLGLTNFREIFLIFLILDLDHIQHTFFILLGANMQRLVRDKTKLLSEREVSAGVHLLST